MVALAGRGVTTIRLVTAAYAARCCHRRRLSAWGHRPARSLIDCGCPSRSHRSHRRHLAHHRHRRRHTTGADGWKAALATRHSRTARRRMGVPRSRMGVHADRWRGGGPLRVDACAALGVHADRWRARTSEREAGCCVGAPTRVHS
eukprot:6610391-Prymnesium_polylepis.1